MELVREVSLDDVEQNEFRWQTNSGTLWLQEFCSRMGLGAVSYRQRRFLVKVVVMRTVSLALGLGFLLLAPVLAQPPGRGGFGGRGDGPGDGRGFPGRGGDSFRGGDPRGGFGGRGGDPRERGGFDPAAMIKRFDTNGNDMIDPSESSQGMAGMFLRRMAERNPRIDLSKPIPIEQLRQEFERMRGGGSSQDSSRGGSSTTAEPELLIPDFSLEIVPPPPEGFGASGALFSVSVEERDRREAEERMRRYDRDRDGFLSKEELSGGRWSDDPMQYDRNRDGRLSASELAVRYANRRVAEQERRASGDNDRGGWSRGDSDRGWSRGSSEKKEEKPSRFGDAKSYRLQPKGASEVNGLPDFFSRSDANGDGQVMMNEFSSSWDANTLAEFLKWDLNSDGIILPRECLAALDNGTRVSGSAASGSSSASRSSSASTSTKTSSAIGGTQMEWAQRQIAKYDKNRDNQLTASEWEKMLIKPVGADANGDGVLTVEEYAAFRAKKR